MSASSAIPGQTSCSTCSEGTFQQDEGQTVCNVCRAGTYADKTGFQECIECPYRLSSTNEGSTCDFCAEGFYLNDRIIVSDNSSIFKDPSTHCLDCPPNGVSCEANSKLSELDLQSGYWRHSNKTSTVYACKDDSNICVGSDQESNQRSRRQSIESGDFGDIYCAEGHKGPLCEVCANEDYYFDNENGECTNCPTIARIVLGFIIICLVAVVSNALSKYVHV